MKTVLATGLAALLVAAGVAGAQPTSEPFVAACEQRTGGPQSIGDLNVLLKSSCADGQKPIELATYPTPPGPQGVKGDSGGHRRSRARGSDRS